MPSLADKLKSLGVKVGTREIPAPQPDKRFPIDSVITGAFASNSLGETFIHEEHFAADYHHGLAPIKLQASLNMMSAWAADARLRDLPIESFAFLDTETSGLSGGTGTYAFLVGVGKFINEEFVLQQFFMRDPSEESALLEGLGEFLASAKALVTFNGKAFDAPLLVTRYTLHNIPVPFRNFAHLDLLPLARRLWRDRLESRALKYLEENILLAPRTVEEVPSYEIPYIYFDYLRDGDARPFKGVFYHNAMDVVAMAALLSHTAKMLEDPFHEGIEHGLDVIALAKLYEDLGQWDTAARLFERGLEKGISEENFPETVRRLSVLQKRRGDFDEALRLWEEAADKGHIYAFIELAKYYEHKKRDVESALKWTKSAQQQIEKSDLPTYMRKHWMDELNHRLQRLETRLGKQNGSSIIRATNGGTMEITISKQKGRVPVTVLQPHGDVDASNYAELLNKARELFNGGAKDFLVDLSDVPFMSSAGLVALHSISMFLRGEQPVDPQTGWAALKSIDRSRGSGIQTHIKLLNPQEMVNETLDKAGFTQFFEVYTDLKKAVASF